MLNKAQKLMDQRKAMIAEAKQVLAVLNADEMIYDAPVVNVVINKGKVVEVKTTEVKTVVETKENEELQKAYDELAANFANRCERIEDLKDELEIKEGIIEHQATTIAALNKQIAEMQAELDKPRTTIVVEDDPIFNEPDVEVEVETVVEETVEQAEEADVMSLLPNIPEKYLANPELMEQLNYWKAEINKQYEDKIVFGKPYSAEAQRNAAIRKANEVLNQLMEELDNRGSYNLTYDEIRTDKNLLTSVYGNITLANKEYAFKYDATFDKPVVYGCMNMDLIDEAKAVIDSMVHFDRDMTALGQKHNHQVVYDFDNNIVVWVSDDGVFKGYTDKYAFVWDPAQAQPCGIVVKNALSSFRKYRKMNKSWGNGFVARAEFIMNYCRQMATNAVAPEETNEVVVNFTNEDNEVETMWDDFEI